MAPRVYPFSFPLSCLLLLFFLLLHSFIPRAFPAPSPWIRLVSESNESVLSFLPSSPFSLCSLRPHNDIDDPVQQDDDTDKGFLRNISESEVCLGGNVWWTLDLVTLRNLSLESYFVTSMSPHAHSSFSFVSRTSLRLSWRGLAVQIKKGQMKATEVNNGEGDDSDTMWVGDPLLSPSPSPSPSPVPSPSPSPIPSPSPSPSPSLPEFWDRMSLDVDVEVTTEGNTFSFALFAAFDSQYAVEGDVEREGSVWEWEIRVDTAIAGGHLGPSHYVSFLSKEGSDSEDVLLNLSWCRWYRTRGSASSTAAKETNLFARGLTHSPFAPSKIRFLFLFFGISLWDSDHFLS